MLRGVNSAARCSAAKQTIAPQDICNVHVYATETPNVKDLPSVSPLRDDPIDRNRDVRSARASVLTKFSSVGVLEDGTCGYERRVLVQCRKRWAKFVSLRKAFKKAQVRLTGDLITEL